MRSILWGILGLGLAPAGIIIAGGCLTTLIAAEPEPSGQYQGPCALAVSKDGRTLYVANADARQVAWVALPGGRVARRTAVPATPTGLALSPDGRKLIVTCAAPKSTILVLDAVSGDLLATMKAGHTAGAPAISPDGKRLYVCNRFDNDVSILDLAAGGEVARVPAVRQPIAAAVTPDGKAVLVANHLSNTRCDKAYEGDAAPVVTVIDTHTHAASAIQLPHGANSARGICVSPDGRHAFVTHLFSNFEMVPFRVDGGWINVNVITILDVPQRKAVRTIGMDENDLGAANPWDITYSADGKWLCVSLAGTHELCFIDSAYLLGDAAWTMTPIMGVWPIYLSLSGSAWRRVALPGKGPRGLAAAGTRIYAAEYFSDTVVVLDLQQADKAAASIALGPPPQLTSQRRGELLFHDATLCYEHWQSCASCHPDGRADGLNWDLLNDGEGNAKNTKSMLLAHQMPPAMWEGARTSAEEAVRSGITHILFAERPEADAAAIDAYLQSLRATPSPHLVDGRLSAAAQHGRALFHDAQVDCGRCHQPPLYTDLRAHNVGSRSPREKADCFYTPTLVEVWRTAPYLHDGRYATVEQLLREGQHGLRGGHGGHGDSLSERDIDDLVEFVLSL